MIVLATRFEDSGSDKILVQSSHQILKCPICHTINYAQGLSDYLEDEYYPDRNYIIAINQVCLYPPTAAYIRGLPLNMQGLYNEMISVKHAPTAFSMVARKLLEKIMIAKQAEGASLYEKVNDLVRRNEIPQSFSGIAHGIRGFGNWGAHEADIELTPDEVPIIEALTVALLEYLYGAPSLIQEASRRLDELKQKKKGP